MFNILGHKISTLDIKLCFIYLNIKLKFSAHACIGTKYGGAGGASAPPALSDRSVGGARWC